MGVYIDMEMPKEDIMMILSPDGTVTFMDHRTAEAIEIPDSHVDLIDRDTLSKSLDRLCNRVCQYSKAQRKVMCSACPLGYVFAVVEDDAPTIIPASEEGET